MPAAAAPPSVAPSSRRRPQSETVRAASRGDRGARGGAHRRMLEPIVESLAPPAFNAPKTTGRAVWQWIFPSRVHVTRRLAPDRVDLSWLPKPADPADL